MVTKTDVVTSFLQNKVVLLPNFLDSGASNVVFIWAQTHPPSRHQSSHVWWEPVPTSKTSGENFDTHIFLLDPLGLVTIETQIFLCTKFKEFNLSRQNFVRWPLRPQCVHLYILAYIWLWCVWAWCVCDICRVGSACMCGVCFLWTWIPIFYD